MKTYEGSGGIDVHAFTHS